jgi:hypothetical protein
MACGGREEKEGREKKIRGKYVVSSSYHSSV